MIARGATAPHNTERSGFTVRRFYLVKAIEEWIIFVEARRTRNGRKTREVKEKMLPRKRRSPFPALPQLPPLSTRYASRRRARAHTPAAKRKKTFVLWMWHNRNAHVRPCTLSTRVLWDNSLKSVRLYPAAIVKVDCYNEFPFRLIDWWLALLERSAIERWHI